MNRLLLSFPLLLTAGVLAGCPGREAAGPGADGKMKVTFWHTRRGEQEAALKAICADYERENPGVDLAPVYQGDYDDLQKKVRASIQGRRLPALTVGYDSQIGGYAAAGVVRPLDDLLKDPEIGLSEVELADIPEQYLSAGRYATQGGRLLSFPFSKSNLVLYYNRTLLRKAGFNEPPETWAEFEKQAAAVTKQTGRPAWAFATDPSTLDGYIFSHGGTVLAEDGNTTHFDQPATVRVFELLQRNARAGTLVEASGDDASGLFTSQGCAFLTETSSGRAWAEQTIGERFEWDVAPIPHAEGVAPVTVMYGPNVCVFKSTPEQERAAWKWVRYFVSPPVTARWARETGYLPLRKSAAELPEMQVFYRENPRARHVLETLPIAKAEPNVVGWQEVRNLLSEAARSVIQSGKAPEAAARELKQRADAVLKQSR